MNKYFLTLALSSALYGCAEAPVQPPVATPKPVKPQACIGATALPAALQDSFEAVEDGALLDKSLGKANKGALCQGQVYRSKWGSKIVLFRAWNSVKSYTEFGRWWAFVKPEGKIADYRKNYAICYNWTPLDMLDECTLKPGTKIVVGTGQSVECEADLVYPTSEAQQIYIDDAKSALTDCVTYTGVFHWQ